MADARDSDTPPCVKVNPAGLPRQCLLLASLSAAAGLGGTAATGRCDGVFFDGSLGSGGALNGPNFLIPADRGKQVGGNLFHSFTDFHLIKDDVATFQGPSSVQNILARVTGGSASSIDGTLRSEISGANLYFINPAGVMFGANAKLDISGSFTVTTADFSSFLVFACGGISLAPTSRCRNIEPEVTGGPRDSIGAAR